MQCIGFMIAIGLLSSYWFINRPTQQHTYLNVISIESSN